MGPVQWAAVGVIVLAVIAVARGLDVRLVLAAAALLIGVAAGEVPAVLRAFLDTFSSEKFVVPICSAMGFAYVLRHTGCDRHLVRLLVKPVRAARGLTVPGVIVVGFIVNIPVISQTSTAVCLGPVVVPLMRAAGYGNAAIAACLCLGASVGGELLNPGAPELNTVAALTRVPPTDLARVHLPPLLFPYAVAAGLMFWLQTALFEKRVESLGSADPGLPPAERINLLKAAVPLVPLVILFVTGPPLDWLHVPQRWLVTRPPAAAQAAVVGVAAETAMEAKPDEKTSTRMIAVAMLVGVVAATLVTPRTVGQTAKQFFEGAGYGYANIISLIVVATCFGKAIDKSGLAGVLGRLIAENPGLLTPLAAVLPCGFAAVSGSGMASTQSLYGFFHTPAEALAADPPAVGAVVSVASAAGRTMSPAAAVVLMCGTLTGVKPFDVVRRVAGPLLFGLTVTVLLRMFGMV